MVYVVSGVGGVVNRAFTAYSHLPNSSIVVGTSKLGLVMRLDDGAGAELGLELDDRDLVQEFWTT